MTSEAEAAETRLLNDLPPAVAYWFSVSARKIRSTKTQRTQMTGPAVPWGVECLEAAHLSPKIKAAGRRLFGTRMFSIDLRAHKYNGEIAFDMMKRLLKSKMFVLGEKLRAIFDRDNLREVLGSYQPPLLQLDQRQDCAGGVPKFPVDFTVWGNEVIYIHVLRLLALAIDAAFQADIKTCLGELLADGCLSHHGIKGYKFLLVLVTWWRCLDATTISPYSIVTSLLPFVWLCLCVALCA